MDSNETLGQKDKWEYIRTLGIVLNKSSQQHPTKQHLEMDSEKKNQRNQNYKHDVIMV